MPIDGDRGSDLWLLVTEAHDRRAWQALGYATWREYVTDTARETARAKAHLP